MRRFLEQLASRLAGFLYGRYGSDELNRFLSVAALALAFASLFLPVLYLPALVLMGWSVFRTLSRNLAARQKERTVFLRLIEAPRRFFRQKTDKFYRYYRCPGCKTTLRVPRGKGKLKITCPKCKTQITKKT